MGEKWVSMYVQRENIQLKFQFEQICPVIFGSLCFLKLNPVKVSFLKPGSIFVENIIFAHLRRTLRRVLIICLLLVQRPVLLLHLRTTVCQEGKLHQITLCLHIYL